MIYQETGIPQGSALGSLLFICYTLKLAQLVKGHGLSAHFYADDSQLYIGTPAADCDKAVEMLRRCLSDVAEWMSRSQLKLNEDKTQTIWLGSRQQLLKIHTDEIVIG